MRTVLCIAAIAVVSFVPVSAQRRSRRRRLPRRDRRRPRRRPSAAVKLGGANADAAGHAVTDAVRPPAVGFALQGPTPAEARAGLAQGTLAPARQRAASQYTSWRT
jgi:hypothetical protein